MSEIISEMEYTYHDTFEDEIVVIGCGRKIDFGIDPSITLIILEKKECRSRLISVRIRYLLEPD